MQDDLEQASEPARHAAALEQATMGELCAASRLYDAILNTVIRPKLSDDDFAIACELDDELILYIAERQSRDAAEHAEKTAYLLSRLCEHWWTNDVDDAALNGLVTDARRLAGLAPAVTP